MLPVVLSSLQFYLWVLGSGVVPFVFVGFCGASLWYAFSVEVAVKMLLEYVRVLVRPFRIFAPERDANMHTQQRRAQIARQVGALRGDLL